MSIDKMGGWVGGMGGNGRFDFVGVSTAERHIFYICITDSRRSVFSLFATGPEKKSLANCML